MTEKPGSENPQNKVKTLTPEFAMSVNACIQELPSATTIRDLLYWREHPDLLPAWTSLMSKSSRQQAIQLGSILGLILRSDKGEGLILKDLVTNFDISTVRWISKQRKLFFQEAFQGKLETTSPT